MSQSDAAHQRFLELYGNNKKAGCHGVANLGASYICPQPTIGGPLNEYTAFNSKCGDPSPNLGRVAYCSVGSKEQRGGGAGLTYNATGTLEKRSLCRNCQKGGSPGCVRFNTERQLPEAVSAVSGYYADLEQSSIGARPVYGAYPQNTDVRAQVQAEAASSRPSRRFDCLQPAWGKTCE